jgi:hypothetical protein
MRLPVWRVSEYWYLSDFSMDHPVHTFAKQALEHGYFFCTVNQGAKRRQKVNKLREKSISFRLLSSKVENTRK